MRLRLVLAAPLAGALLAGCPAHNAYGPGSDERLEQETSTKSSQEGAADVTGLKCDDMQNRLRDAKSDEKPEAERVKMLTELYKESKSNVTKFDDAVAKNPDLVFTAQGDAVKSNMEGCRSAYADIRADFERYLREIADLPIINETQGTKLVPVARLDFGVVREAINTLDPDDKDVLLGKIDSAEKKVQKSEEEGGGKRKGKGK